MSDILANFATKTLHRWSEIHEHQRGDFWVFRGQKKSDWPLSTTLERCCMLHSGILDNSPEIEYELRREFRRAYHHHALHVPNRESTFEWLSLMQHFGAPTRLLDFTYSIYVAMYFAVENADEESAVWAVRFNWAMEKSVAIFGKAGWSAPKLRNLANRFTEETESISEPLFFGKRRVKVACPINPFRLNERLQVQKGLFLIPGDTKVPFMENLNAMHGHNEEENVYRLRIPAELAEEARRNLFNMNITRRSLFPGLEGYSQALGVYHPIFDPNRLGRK